VSNHLGSDKNDHFYIIKADCPSCGQATLILKRHYLGGNERNSVLVYPKGVSRAPLGNEVPEKLSADYTEACLVLSDSAKASAALSRRCLQVLLRDVAKVKPSDLSKEIDEVLGSKSLPTHLAEAVDAVRNIGNFAAHPMKSTSTGEIVDVEPGEAEWLLDVLEGLFDFYFVQPAVLQKKKEALNKKLAEAGKPAMK
jgi:hypothetical protein